MPYAEDVNYWMTSKMSPDAWLERAKKEIQRVGGKVGGEGFISDASTGRAAFLLSFSFGDNRYDLKWPVLRSKKGIERAARVQAATALYHDVKSRCVAAKFHGPHFAFANYLVLPSGQTVNEASSEELAGQLPHALKLLPPPK
jgi:hypothetical protein